MKKIIVPILIISLGVAWLLNVKNILPGVNWVWTIGLAVTGLVLLVTDKINKFNLVLGLFLMISSVFSILRQTGKIHPDIEMPILFITLGVLIMSVQLLNLPSPSWITEDGKKTEPLKKPDENSEHTDQDSAKE